MRKISTLLISLTLLLPVISFGQSDERSPQLGDHTFTSGNTSLTLGGYLIAFYQYEPRFTGDTKTSKNNTFDLDDARMYFKGFAKGTVKFNIEVNYATLVEMAVEGLAAIKDAPLTECNVEYVNPYVNVKVGYFKLPFSASSLIDKVPSPFLGRSLIADGDYVNRRDAGILLSHDFWHQRISLTAGIVSGMGEQILLGKEDPNGQPSYVGRVVFSNAYYREEEVDYRNLKKPIFRIAFDGMYNNKTTWFGTDGTNTVDLENVKTINGQKLTYGLDAGFMWRGFSAQFELDNSYYKPAAADAALLPQPLALYNTQYFLDGGYLAQINYYSKPLQSVFAIRYSSFRETDLQAGNEMTNLTFAYNFLFKPYHITVKLHYDYAFKQPDNNQKWEADKFRAGIQYVF